MRNEYEFLGDAAKAMEAADNQQLEALSEVSAAIAAGPGHAKRVSEALSRLSARNKAATEAKGAFLAALDRARLAYAEREVRHAR